MGLQFVEILMETEREFSIEIPDAAEIRCVGDLHAVVVSALSPRNTPWSSDSVWFRLQEIIGDTLGLPPERITRDADFYADLGAG